jgi:hypothetical protein
VGGTQLSHFEKAEFSPGTEILERNTCDMKYLPVHAALLFLMLFFIAGCGTNDKLGETKNNPSGKDSARPEDQARDRHDTDLQAVKLTVLKWDKANNPDSAAFLGTVYADEVDLYGRVYVKKDAMNFKSGYFKNHKGYRQHLGKDINIEELQNGNRKIHFTKYFIDKGVEKSTAAYLVLQKSGNDWKIIEENDDTSLVKATRREDIPMKEKDITSCDKAAEAIFLSSDKVQDLLIQKYVSYTMEYKPGDPKNPTNRYWFWVFASPPNAGKVETYGRYQVDSRTGQLYEYDVVADDSKPISSNTSLVKYLKKYCGK